MQEQIVVIGKVVKRVAHDLAVGRDGDVVRNAAKPQEFHHLAKFLMADGIAVGTVCQYSITDTDIKAGNGNEVQLGVTYTISVYAAKAGYENSETATATLCWIDAAPKTEGITNGIANIPAQAISNVSLLAFTKRLK